MQILVWANRDWFVLRGDIIKYGLQLNQQYTKNFIKSAVTTYFLLKQRTSITSMHCLRYYHQKLFPTVDWSTTNGNEGKWWTKLGIGAVWLGERTKQLFCMVCKAPTMETVPHFMFKCVHSTDFPIFDNLQRPPSPA